MNKYIYTLLLLGTIFVSSCDDFLDKVPDERTSLNSKDAILELLVSAYPEAEYASFLEPLTDNFGHKGKISNLYNPTAIQEAYRWQDHTTSGSGTPAFYWNACYTSIAASNHVLARIEEMSDAVDLQGAKAEALLTRAYCHFMLVNIFARHYNPETAISDLGVPYVDKPEKTVIVKYKRNTVKEVYDRIVADVETALPLLDDKNYVVPKYHFTKSAANAFASRLYLYMGNWSKVIEHANKVFSSGDIGTQLRPWKTRYKNYTYNELEINYTKKEENSNLLLTTTSSLWGRYFSSGRYGMTTDISDELFPTQYAYKVFGSDIAKNIPKFNEYFKYTNVVNGVGYAKLMVPIFTTEEVLLNRAEAKLFYDGSADTEEALEYGYDKSLEDLEIFLSERINVNLPSPLTKAVIDILLGVDTSEPEAFYPITQDQKSALKYILNLRRKEFIYEGLRWFDIKRYNLPVEHNIVDEDPIRLEKDDNRRVLQIPEEAIINGLQKNPR
ncbi:MAG: RagB/SusD family nutrient uptake outer membrane protein [Marinifilaceae bacterium]|nr:RagB/SusD family nutrient uptake outer membrane protein [Marinifilaceae bacterium]